MLNKSSNFMNVMSLILIFVSFLGVVFYLNPEWGKLNELTSEKDAKVKTKVELTAKLEKLKKLQSELNLSSEISQNTVLAAIPEHFGESDLIRLFSEVAKKNGMVLNGISFGVSNGSNSGVVTKSSVSASLVGDKSQFISFLKGIEGSARKVIVKNITVQNGEGEMASQISFNLNMEVYYQGLI